MFQFRRFPAYAYLIQRTLTDHESAGLPHSEISGSMRMCRSPKLIAACHVLRRLLMPRHSPCALFRLTSSEQTALIPFPSVASLPPKTSYRSVAPPLKIEPASLGFDFAFTGEQGCASRVFTPWLLAIIAVLRIMQAFSRVFFLKLYYFYPLIKSSTILECVLYAHDLFCCLACLFVIVQFSRCILSHF